MHKTGKRKKLKKGMQKTVKQLNCSPLVKNKKVVSSSCMTPEVLLKIRDEYNKDHSQKIVATKPALIWHELRMKLNCQDERKWVNEIDDPKLRAQIKKQLFAPEHPPEWFKNKNEWLTNFDIDMVMEQYEMENKDFKYLGTTPIDYDYIVDTQSKTCVEDNLCKFNLKKLLSQGKRRFASVFNLDKHDESGSHWVSVFIDVNKRIIMFFDSASGSIPKKINEFINDVKAQGLSENIEFKYINGKKKHQYGGSECGVYSIHFIIEMLKHPEKAMHIFLYDRIPDKEIEKYRKKYFNTPENV
jgi:hypothetical protein